MGSSILVSSLRYEGEKIKGSRFIASAVPVRTPEEAAEQLARIRPEFPTANHHCWAYRLGPGTDRFRYSDDGEPSGSAGRPILQQIEGRQVTDVLVVVSRIFGGTKLGVGGLIRAYGGAAADVLDRAETRPLIQLRRLFLTFPYALTGQVKGMLAAAGVEAAGADYGESVVLTLELPEADADGFLDALSEQTAGRVTVRRVDP